MPGLNVRGDQHLNFTPAEAAAWLGDTPARGQVPRVLDIDEAIAPGIGLGWLLVVLVLIAGGIYSRTIKQTAVVTSQDAPPIAHMPRGWFYGRMHGQLPLRDRAGKNIGALPDGARFFGTGAASETQIIVAADGSYWGYGELEMPDHVRNVPTASAIKPEFERAEALIGQIELNGIADALRRNPRHAPKYGYLPTGWTYDCLEQDELLTYGVDGIKVGTVRKGTCLIYEIADVRGWRFVVSPDGSYRGYAHIPLLYEVPKRTAMQPEFRGAVSLVQRLADGSAPPWGLDEMREALAKDPSTILLSDAEEQ